jgi:spore maturation protein CgeB
VRVGVIGQFYSDAFAWHIAEALEGMGHETTRVEVGMPATLVSHGNIGKALRAASGIWRRLGSHNSAVTARRTARLLESVRDADMILATHDYLEPSAVATLRKTLGIPVVVWCPDSIMSYGRGMFLNAPYDAVFIKDPSIVESIRRESDTPAFYLPECCNPHVHKPVALDPADLLKFGCDIATAGNMYPSRAAFFAQLTNYDVRIWGNAAPSWMDVTAIRGMIKAEYITGPMKAKAFLSARVVVNNLHHAEVGSINARAFEIAGIGAFQIISWRPSIAALFEEGTEIVTYRTIPDLKNKLRRFLPDDAARAAIAAAGRARAVREHTYERRLEVLIATVRGSARGFASTPSGNEAQ